MTAPNVLDRIVARTRVDVEVRCAALPLARVEATLAPTSRDFAGALRSRPAGPRLIAEFKPRSPSRGVLRSREEVRTVVGAYARYAGAISVLCDRPFFDGGYDLLSAARATVETPLLAKDFVVGEYQIAEARAAGADAVLLMVSVLGSSGVPPLLAYARSLGMAALVETHDDDELAVALDAGADVIGVNSRDLRTLEIDEGNMLRRLDRLPAGVVRVAESGVSTAGAVGRLASLADAVLIGTALVAEADTGAAIEALGFRPLEAA
ncbi:MAG: indole-3-glycerol-phosphate synthase [Myxococcales bacterium]|nr:indole-3-glycerol-phosphate synthase [Myxococcales bacterium]MCB9531579.1 indole-3-glycerol-phosphate synthase [Myxococcales bacterium]MCB9532770.1 indole-3-glycerol-phosphate synthase [Myxococcales bacterium]